MFTFALKPSANHNPFWDWGYDGPTSNRMRKHGLVSLFRSVPSWDGIRWGVYWYHRWDQVVGQANVTRILFVAYKLHQVQSPPLEWKWKLFSMMPYPYCRSSFIIHHAMCLSLCGVITHMHVKNAHPRGWGFLLAHLSNVYLYCYTLFVGLSKLIMCIISHVFKSKIWNIFWL